MVLGGGSEGRGFEPRPEFQAIFDPRIAKESHLWFPAQSRCAFHDSFCKAYHKNYFIKFSCQYLEGFNQKNQNFADLFNLIKCERMYYSFIHSSKISPRLSIIFPKNTSMWKNTKCLKMKYYSRYTHEHVRLHYLHLM